MDSERVRLLNGDCLEKLKDLPENSVDSIVTDPPYGLSFMGKHWDKGVPGVEFWVEMIRVLKPGGYLLAFSGTRTYHRMATAIEDAGFEIRDMIEWVYGSGFPKSHNIGKAVDKLQGNEREVIKVNETIPENLFEKEREVIKDKTHTAGMGTGKSFGMLQTEAEKKKTNIIKDTKGTSDWEGWGTALKPSHEPICCARKPLSEKTVAENVLKWKVGGINIDESRVGIDPSVDDPRLGGNGNWSTKNAGWVVSENSARERVGSSPKGRFPSNLIHDNSEEVRECFPDAGGGKYKKGIKRERIGFRHHYQGSGSIKRGESTAPDNYGDSGNASRFFKSIIYQAKSSKAERNKGLDGYLTVKHNIPKNGGVLCKEEITVAVQLLQKVISEQELVSFNIGECGESIMGQCHKDSLSTILTETKRIIGLKIYSSLMHSLTRESTQDVNSEMEVGGSLAESVADLRRWILTITKGNQELALGASLVVCEMLHSISVEENWKEKTNIHSTVKPTALMSYLIKMVTPKGGTVLDPFMGSGSTGVAAKQCGFPFIGIELDPEYFKIAEKRINQVLQCPDQDNQLPLELNYEPEGE